MQSSNATEIDCTVDFTSLRTCVRVVRVRKREACSESCGNDLITHAVTHHARSKRSEINSKLTPAHNVCIQMRPVNSHAGLSEDDTYGIVYCCFRSAKFAHAAITFSISRKRRVQRTTSATTKRESMRKFSDILKLCEARYQTCRCAYAEYENSINKAAKRWPKHSQHTPKANTRIGSSTQQQNRTMQRTRDVARSCFPRLSRCVRLGRSKRLPIFTPEEPLHLTNTLSQSSELCRKI